MAQPHSEPCIADVMRRHFVSIDSSSSLREAESVMRSGRLRQLPVVDAETLSGVLSHRDVLLEWVRRLEREIPAERLAELRARPIEDVVVREPEWVTPDAPLWMAASRMSALGVGCLPVVVPSEEGLRLVGLVTESDLLGVAFRRERSATV